MSNRTIPNTSRIGQNKYQGEIYRSVLLQIFNFQKYTLNRMVGLQRPTRGFLACNVEIVSVDEGDGASPSKRRLFGVGRL